MFAGNLHLSSTEINYEKILKIEQRVDEYVLRVPYLRKIMLTGGRCHNTYKGKRIGKFEGRTIISVLEHLNYLNVRKPAVY